MASGADAGEAPAREEVPAGAPPQKPFDNEIWMHIDRELRLPHGAQEAAYAVVRSSLLTALNAADAKVDWTLPTSNGRDGNLEEALSSAVPVRVEGEPASMGYYYGSQPRSWPGAVERWAAAGVEREAGWDADTVCECCRRHPGDREEDDVDDGSAPEERNESFDFSVVTKAAEQVHSIAFASPAAGAAANPAPPLTTMRAAYQMQLHVRVDRARGLLVYDCFEFMPGFFKDWPMPVTRQQVYRIQRNCWRDPFERSYSDSDDDGNMSGADEPDDEIDKSDLLNLFAQKVWGDFKRSRVFRLRVSLADIVGISLVQDAGEEEEPSEERLARLVVELSAPPPPGGFASRYIQHKQDGANRWRKISDWTPSCCASAATRHYISGAESELLELAKYLSAVCPRLKRMMMASDEANTLRGAGVDLRPSAAPQFAGGAAATSVAAAAEGAATAAAAAALALREQEVHDALRKLDVKDPERVSNCVKAAILNGHIALAKGLDQVLLQDASCPHCPATRTVTVRDVLSQRDIGGTAELSAGAAVKCPADSDGWSPHGFYITRICQGKPETDDGKYHNHCCSCPGFGTCMGDHRRAHCELCGSHYYGGRCDDCGGRGLATPAAPPAAWDAGIEGVNEVQLFDLEAFDDALDRNPAAAFQMLDRHRNEPAAREILDATIRRLTGVDDDSDSDEEEQAAAGGGARRASKRARNSKPKKPADDGEK